MDIFKHVYFHIYILIYKFHLYSLTKVTLILLLLFTNVQSGGLPAQIQIFHKNVTEPFLAALTIEALQTVNLPVIDAHLMHLTYTPYQPFQNMTM